MLQSNISQGRVQEAARAPVDVSVVIVSWNVRSLLVQCVRALASPQVRDGLNIEVVIVDNASSDGSAEAVEGCAAVRVIKNKANLGYGRANNQGFAEAEGRYMLVLNPDTVPLPGSLSALVAFADRHPRAAVVAPRLLNPDGTIQQAAFRFPSLWMALLDLFPLPRLVPGRVRLRIEQSVLNGRYTQQEAGDQPFRIDHPLGACMLINRQAYMTLGGFDPGLFMYSEEVDLAMRYSKEGWQLWQVPQARVVHLGRQSARQISERMFVELWRSRLYIYDKHYDLASRLALRTLLALSQTQHAVAALAALATGRISKRDAHRRWRQAGAVLKLLRGRKG